MIDVVCGLVILVFSAMTETQRETIVLDNGVVGWIEPVATDISTILFDYPSIGLLVCLRIDNGQIVESRLQR